MGLGYERIVGLDVVDLVVGFERIVGLDAVDLVDGFEGIVGFDVDDLVVVGYAAATGSSAAAGPCGAKMESCTTLINVNGVSLHIS